MLLRLFMQESCESAPSSIKALEVKAYSHQTESDSENEKDQRTMEKDQRISDKHQRKFSLSLLL